MSNEKMLNWIEAAELQKQGVQLQSRDGSAMSRKGPDDWHDVPPGDYEITEYLSDFDFRVKP